MSIPSTGTPAALDAAASQQLLTAAVGPRLIEVRTPGEFEAAHIPGSDKVPLDVLREHRNQLRAHLDEPVVLVGISAWRAAGETVRTGGSRGDLERQVRLVAGSIVLASVLASGVVPR
jgi:hypothetical protein